MKRFGIIGCGFSGLMTAYHLLAHGGDSCRVTIYDRDFDNFGPAYKTKYRSHLLNVRARSMGAFPSAEDDFVLWCEKNGWGVDPQAFVPRSLYRSYLLAIKDRLLKRYGERFELRKSEVTSIKPTDTVVELTADTVELFDTVLLAIGNLSPKALEGSSPRILNDPWSSNALEAIPAADSITIVGMGLTGIDIVLALAERNHQGKIFGISASGLLPCVHEPTSKYDTKGLPLPTDAKDFRELRKIMRKHVAIAPNWQSVITWGQPYYQAVWKNLSFRDKERFLKHYNKYWNVLRHRIPAKVDSTIKQLISSEQLQLISARVTEFQDSEGSLQFRVGEKTYRTDWALNCGGPTYGETRGISKLIDELHSAGSIRNGPHDIGLDTTESGQLIRASGTPHRNLFAIGGLRRGTLWETTAVPNLRTQALEVAWAMLK